MKSSITTLGRAVTAEMMEAWLRDHPDFLALRPDLYLRLEPPMRVHGERMADHMAAMLAAARVHVREVDADMQAALTTDRAGLGLAARVGEAVLALMRAPDPLECVTHELPALLGVDSCHVGCESRARRNVVRLPAGTLGQLLPPGRDAVVRVWPLQVEILHREAAPLVRRDALARVPAPGGQPMLLAIGARDPEALPTTGAESLAFLGRAVGAALAR